MSKDRETYLKFKPMADDLRKAESWCELDGVLNRYQTVKNLYKMGYRKQSEWISVGDRLPEENGQYLASVDISHSAFEKLTTIAIVAYGKSHGFYLYNETEKVTHWMPLPEFPKVKGGDSQ